jgi:hypothetical protein
MKRQISKGILVILLILTACHNTPKNDESNEISLIEQGASFAMQTQAVLASNLITAINDNGTIDALAFCSEKAYPLTDSMAIEFDVKLKRVSDQPRNSNNRAKGKEKEYILKSKQLLAKGEDVKPEIIESKGKVIAYYPIFTNQICMQCHGKKNTEVLPQTLTKIAELYPSDEGIGYGINELRGIWVVEMKK